MGIRAPIGRGVPARRIYGMVDEACMIFLQIWATSPFELQTGSLFPRRHVVLYCNGCISNICQVVVSSAWYSVPWSQILDTFCPKRKMALRSTLRNLRCSKISMDRVSAEEPGVLSKPGGTMSPIRKGFGTQGSAEAVINLHWTIQII
jgi:hypothetical protein